jgi:hypothetical protein
MKIIKTTKDKECLVSDKDFEELKKYNWYYCDKGNGKNNDGYVYGYINGKLKSIHRIIMGEPKGMEIDHKNGDKLDNQRENLRICNRSQNVKWQRERSAVASFKEV